MKSIAFANGQWYLLRSDGAIMTSPTLSDPTKYTPIPGLTIATAKKLSMGRGTTNNF